MQRVGAYEVLYELKSGGMGSVLLARRRGPGSFEKLVAIKTIRAEFPRSRFIALTVYEGDEDIHSALEAGAQAYLLKNVLPSELVATIRAVHAGLRRLPPEVAERLSERGPGPGLTPREVEVLRLMAKGQSNVEIARSLKITSGTATLPNRPINGEMSPSRRNHPAG